MESLSSKQLAIVNDLLGQIKRAILDLQQWNESIKNADEWLSSPDGMKTLAANCMLLEAIGEGFRNIDERTHKQLLVSRPEIPWREVIAMRNHIAHGYFDINSDLVWDVIQNELGSLLEATDFFIAHLYELIPIDN
ncbi:MAG: DUF86 domain-containing protein [Bacteroidaceae bacterium]|nr:DUF86 domain-containing protein [Bacteroidaceae bacterium]